MTVSQKAVEAALNNIEVDENGMCRWSDVAKAADAIARTPTEASAPVQPEPDAGLVEALDQLELADKNCRVPETRFVRTVIEALRRTQPSTAQPSQGEAVANDAGLGPEIEEILSNVSPVTEEERRSLTVFDEPNILMKMLRRKPSGRDPDKYFASITIAEANEAANRIAVRDKLINQLMSELEDAAKVPVDVGAAVAAETERCAVIADFYSYHAGRDIRQSTLGEPKEGGENG